MKSIIFFDIDGTLITDDGTAIIPESTKRAITKARENGHLAFINTGRTISNVEQNIRDIGFDGYVCSCGMYIECSGEVLLDKKLERNLCYQISDLIRKCDMTPLYERSDKFFMDKSVRRQKKFDELIETFKTQNKNVNHFVEDEDFSFDKFVAWYDNDSKLDEFKNEITKDFEFIDREFGFCEVVPKGYSKATGIDVVLKHYGISLENAYAVGDSMNDLQMLQAVPNSISMGNGNMQKYASFVTKDIMDDGIEYALKHFNLI